jgi:hypothetical protein
VEHSGQALARTSAVRWAALTARHPSCADLTSLNAIATPAAREAGPLVTTWDNLLIEFDRARPGSCVDVKGP